MTKVFQPAVPQGVPAGHDDVPVTRLGQGSSGVEAQTTGGTCDDHSGLLGGRLAVVGGWGGGGNPLCGSSAHHHAAGSNLRVIGCGEGGGQGQSGRAPAAGDKEDLSVRCMVDRSPEKGRHIVW